MAVPTTSPSCLHRRSSIRSGSPPTRTRSRCRVTELVLLLALCSCRSIIGIDEPAESSPCESVDDCGGPYPKCHLETKQCVACVAHDECSSGLCDPAGSCIDASAIAYVSTYGSGGACTRAEPCRMQTALDSDKPNVLVDSVVIGPLIISRDVRVFGGAGGRIDNATGNRQPAVAIYAGTVEIHDLLINAASVEFAAHGVSVAGETARVRLVGLEIAHHGGAGVAAKNGGEVTLLRSRIHHNSDGGVRMIATKFTITDNFIYANGDPATTAGGVYLDGDASSTFAFNTVVANTSYAQSPYVSGINCMGAYAENNLVYANRHGADPAQISGTCVFGNTAFGIDPSIVKFTLSDLHITGATPRTIRDAVECTGFDIDHQPRPQHGSCDLGADEFSPL